MPLARRARHRRRALLKVQVEQDEYWDPESSTLVQLTDFVKALATGERYEGGEHEKLEM